MSSTRARAGNILRLPILLATTFMLAPCAHRAVQCGIVPPGRYFPVGTFGTGTAAEQDADDQRAYGGDLCAMSEPPLRETRAFEAYRFYWGRSFHDPVSVRIEASNGSAKVIAAELNEAHSADPGAIRRRKERALSSGAWSQVQEAIRAAGFWETPTKDGPGGLDGATWILEGYRGGVYHVVKRWSPSGPFRAACEAFLRASGFSFPADEIY